MYEDHSLICSQKISKRIADLVQSKLELAQLPVVMEYRDSRAYFCYCMYLDPVGRAGWKEVVRTCDGNTAHFLVQVIEGLIGFSGELLRPETSHPTSLDTV